MSILTNSLFFDFIIGLLFFAFLFYKYWTRNYKYWEKRGVVQLEPSFPFGTVGFSLLQRKDHFGLAHQKIYNQFKGERYVGNYTLNEPELMLRDPELIKHIMTKDFNHFVNRGMVPLIKHDFINSHLFNMEGEPWKRMRNKLTPTFTSGKMKFMFNLIEVVAQQLTDYLKPLAEKSSIIEIKDIIARFNTDIIATCAFGLEVDSLKNAESEFRQIGRLIFNPTIFSFLKRYMIVFAPQLFKIFPIALTNPKVSEFILHIVKDTTEYRKKNKVVRNDFIDLLTRVKEKTVDKEDEASGEAQRKDFHPATDDELTLKEMAAQVFVFFAAGFETAASTTSFFLFELSKNKQIQDKVRLEIDTVLQRNGGKVTYEALQEMHYMDQCIDETLRRYASLPFLRRQCVKTYKVPDSDLVIEEGIKIVIPIYSIHHDPEYYPDPFKYDPERFSKEAINSRHHYTHLPFGEGPRMCIGKRLGIMQVKMAVTTILKDFEVTPAPGLPDQLPIATRMAITSPAVQIDLLLSERKPTKSERTVEPVIC